jgi:glycerol-3-phosphate acyltransferase PlsY
MIFNWVLLVVVGYFLGNVSTGLFVGKWLAGIDIRQHGSGNAGATNIMRTLGWLPSVLTLIGDALKAVLAALIGRWLAGDNGALLGGLCAVVGHNWPVVWGFKGGKGIAASFGVLLVVDPWMALALFGVQVVLLAATRYMSVASIATAVGYVVLTLIFRFGQLNYIAFSLVISALALYSHRGNMRRLRAGAENRLDFKKITEISNHK